MITGGDLRQSRLDVGYKTFTISPWGQDVSHRSPVATLIVDVIQELNSHHLKELAYLQYGFLTNYKIIVCFVLYVELAG